MEIDITKFVEAHADNMEAFSNSVACSGLQNIGQVTWRAATEETSDESRWLTSDLDALRDHFQGYGAWSREELASMSGTELNALLIQFIAGDYQERAQAEERGELASYEENYGGRLYVTCEGQWFYLIGD